METSKLRPSRAPTHLLVQHQSSAADAPEVDYATNLSTHGMFIQTPHPAPVGASLAVTFAPARDARLVQGYCRVTEVTPEGMATEFVQLDQEGQALLGAALS